jgi:nucleotide-binding universal stress UspA family protein
MRAQLLSAMLERNGIECFMTNINRIKESPGGVNVNIQEGDSKQAIRIYADFKGSYGEQKQKAVEYMRSIRRILVPVDFTPHAENAAYYALQLAAVLKANIQLVNTYLDPLGSPQSYLESYTYQLNLDKIIREIEEETEKSLIALAGRLENKIKEEKLQGVHISWDMNKGNAVNSILAKADDYKPGLIIMGTRGSELSGIRSFGSVTAQLIEKSRLPILAIPHDYDGQWAKLPKRVLYATNFDQTDFSALRRLVSFIKPFKSKLYCVHVAQDDSETMDEIQMRKMKDYLTGTIDDFSLECGLLKTVDLQQGLEDFIIEREIDVLALTTHKRSFFERIFKPSVTKKFLFQTHIPLLVFQSRP